MSTSRVTTVEAYLASLPPDRRDGIEAVRRAIAALALCLMAVAGTPEARADGIPRFPFEVYAGAGVTEWAHAEVDLVFGPLGYILGRAAVAGRGDPLLGGGLVLTVPFGRALDDGWVPAHALLLGLAAMYNPDSPGFTNRRRPFMSPLLQDPLHGYGEATIGYGFHARSGLGIRIVGGSLFDELGFLVPIVRFSIGAGERVD